MKDCRYCAMHSYCWQQQGVCDPVALSQRQISQRTGIWVGPRPVIERVEQRKITYVAPVGKQTRNPRLSSLHFNHYTRYIS